MKNKILKAVATASLALAATLGKGYGLLELPRLTS